MFRKILIGFVILVVLVGFSYLKTMRDHAKQDELYEKTRQELTSENDLKTNNYENKIDSLGNLLTSTKDSYENSITGQTQKYDSQLDSLENIIDKQTAKITTLSKSATQNKPQSASKAKPKPKQLSQHEQIYRYYKKRYTDLPLDLSEYEKKIALSEIREETASKFAISLSKLSKIRKEYKLSY